MKLSDDSATMDANPTAPATIETPVVKDIPEVNQLGADMPNGGGVVKADAHIEPEHTTNGNVENDGDQDATAAQAESSDDEEVEEQPEAVAEEGIDRKDMYLDAVSESFPLIEGSVLTFPMQISRQNLDFDFERVCSKSLTNINVYCCLVCGKYFQGRGRGSYAYRHAVGENHRVWLNLETEKVCYSVNLISRRSPYNLRSVLCPSGGLPCFRPIIAGYHPRPQPTV